MPQGTRAERSLCELLKAKSERKLHWFFNHGRINGKPNPNACFMDPRDVGACRLADLGAVLYQTITESYKEITSNLF